MHQTAEINKELTKTQSLVFQFITRSIDETGSPPTLQEIAEHFDYKSINAAVQHLHLIEQKGFIQILHGKARGIRVVKRLPLPVNTTFEENGIPVLGCIAAGKPSYVFEETDRYLPIPNKSFGVGEFFAVEVKGESMVGAGIFERDMAIIRKQPDVESGQIAAIIVDDEATLKRYIKKKSKIILRAENSAFADLEFTQSGSQSLTIAGLMVGLIRGVDPLERGGIE